MSSISDVLHDCIRSVERPGDFCVGDLREIFMPAIDVDGVGRIAFPILPAQVEPLIGIAETAPYGRGEETLVDRTVRRTWQIDPSRVRIGGRHWDGTLADLVVHAARGLGVSEPVSADFYKLLIYDAGAFFVDHRDTEKVPGMFATLVIILPSAHCGGEIIVRHLGREVILDPRPEDPSEIGLAAFYADCVHEVRPVTSGCRVALVYNLRFLGKKTAPTPPDYRAEQDRITELLLSWNEAADEPDKLILPLEHAYTQAELSFETLKGRDAAIASVLVGAAAAAECDLHLALVSIEESGSAEHTGHYRRRRYQDWDQDDDEEFEVGEIFDCALTLSQWRRPDGGTPALGDFPFTEDELCPPEAFEDLSPDEEHFHEATGNEGASFERTYRRAGLVIWPHSRRLAVLNQAGLGATLPYLEDVAARWEMGDRSTRSALWQEADELSGHMLRSWPRSPWRPDGDICASRMLDLQVRLRNEARIDGFLAEISAEGHFAASDNEAIIRAAALLSRSRAADLLMRIVRRNAPGRLGALGGLLRLSAAQSVGDPAGLGAALLDALPGDPAKASDPAEWRRPEPITPGFVFDLLTTLCRIDEGLAAQAIAHVLAWPKSYPMDTVLVPAALDFAQRSARATEPAVERLRQACLDHLRERIARPLEAPTDMARTNSLTCPCADCGALGAFLVDPHQSQWRLKAILDRRGHIEEQVRGKACDLDLATEKRGSPHTLVATKNQNGYERRAKQRRQDLEHATALGAP